MNCCTSQPNPNTKLPFPNEMTTQNQTFVVDRDDEEILHKTRAGRTLRNRKYRRAVEDQRQSKRLFTPEIKRFLKSWLVRRRKNPYPNRSEKKDLALKTGLTYVQVCNWFANWRRKLKKSSRERQRSSWGNLIKDYNTKAEGNVEQFSISSDDSIWHETPVHTNNDSSDVDQLNESNADISSLDHCYFSLQNGEDGEQHRYELTTNEFTGRKDICSVNSMLDDLDRNANKINRKCAKALSFCTAAEVYTKAEVCLKQKAVAEPPPPLLLSKWLESAAKFVPRDSFVAWTNARARGRGRGRQDSAAEVRRLKARVLGAGAGSIALHHREELDAAEALTSLSRQSWLATRHQ